MHLSYRATRLIVLPHFGKLGLRFPCQTSFAAGLFP